MEAQLESRKQWVDPESMRVMILELGSESEVSRIIRELGLERADALSRSSVVALRSPMQSSVGAET